MRRYVARRFNYHCFWCLLDLIDGHGVDALPALEWRKPEYDHYRRDFSRYRGHDREDIVLLCPTHHAEKTANRPSATELAILRGRFEALRTGSSGHASPAFLADVVDARPSDALRHVLGILAATRFADPSELRKWINVEADLLRRAGKILPSLSLLEFAAALDDRQIAVETRLETNLLKMRGLAKQGRFGAAYRIGRRALATAASSGMPRLDVSVRIALGNCIRQGQLPVGRGTYAETLLPSSFRPSRGLGNAQASNLINLGTDLRQALRFSQALATQREARTLALEAGDHRNAAIALGNSGLTWRDQGDLQRAHEIFKRVVRERIAIEDVWGAGLYSVLAAEIALELRKPQAIRAFATGISLLQGEGDYHVLPKAVLGLAAALKASGRNDDAALSRRIAAQYDQARMVRGISDDRLFLRTSSRSLRHAGLARDSDAERFGALLAQHASPPQKIRTPLP